MKLTYFSVDCGFQPQRNFTFNNIELKRVWEDSDDIDFISFASVQINVGIGVKKSQIEFLNQIKTHPNYEFAKNNPHLPMVFYHEHEILLKGEYELFTSILCEEFKTDKSKIILIDSSLKPKDGVINPPKILQLKQYRITVSEYETERDKKFAFLNNKNRKLRSQIFDKVISIYEDDVDTLRNENIITFRNYSELNTPPAPSSDIAKFQKFIDSSTHYKFNHNIEFFNNLNLPWVLDDFKIGHEYEKMYSNLHEIYSSTYFSLIPETYYSYLNLNYDVSLGENMAFSEKGLLALSAGNLPFVIHHGEYYVQLESAGFDFSYLKTLFGIDYRENDLRKNFESIQKFVSYLKNNSLQTIGNDYNSLKSIVDHNKNILRNVQQNEPNNVILSFFQQIKYEKYK